MPLLAVHPSRFAYVRDTLAYFYPALSPSLVRRLLSILNLAKVRLHSDAALVRRAMSSSWCSTPSILSCRRATGQCACLRFVEVTSCIMLYPSTAPFFSFPHRFLSRRTSSLSWTLLPPPPPPSLPSLTSSTCSPLSPDTLSLRSPLPPPPLPPPPLPLCPPARPCMRSWTWARTRSCCWTPRVWSCSACLCPRPRPPRCPLKRSQRC